MSEPGGPMLARAAAAFEANDLPGAERLVRERLQQAPDDVAALRLLAAIAAASGHDAPAEQLLRRRAGDRARLRRARGRIWRGCSTGSTAMPTRWPNSTG